MSSEFRVDPRIFGVRQLDVGHVYVIESRGLFKIGRTRNPAARLKTAQTWVPEMKLVGMKPFWDHREVERAMHVGFAQSWHEGEWFRTLDDAYREILVDGFSEFSDTDYDRNSVDFIYWVNGSGMNEFTLEQSRRCISRRRFQRETSSKPRS